MTDAQVKSRAIPRDEAGDDPAGVVLLLASPGADFVPGQTHNANGGKRML
jgi:hypothetical protein